MDDILREVRAIREAFAREFDYDLDAIHRHLVDEQEKMREEGWRIVNFSHPRTAQDGGMSESPKPVEAGSASHPSDDEQIPIVHPEMTPILP
jgi:hypothetical protein